MWVSLAKKYIYDIHLNWDKTREFAFSTDSYPEDEQLNIQIVKVNFNIKKKSIKLKIFFLNLGFTSNWL